LKKCGCRTTLKTDSRHSRRETHTEPPQYGHAAPVLHLSHRPSGALGALVSLREHAQRRRFELRCPHQIGFADEHRGGIYSFDQGSEELGKVLARDIEPLFDSGDVAGLDPSTARLLQRLR